MVKEGLPAASPGFLASSEDSGRFAELAGDRAIDLVNLMRFRDQADYPANRAEAAESLSGKAAYGRYLDLAFPVVRRVGGRFVYAGLPERTFVGPADERWDIVIISRYPDAGALQSLSADPAFAEACVHRAAGLADSRTFQATNCGDVPLLSMQKFFDA